MKHYLKNLSKFFRLIDEQGQLSLTNLAVLVIIIKIAITSNVSIADAGALLISLLNYSGKKVLSQLKKPVLTLPEQLFDQTQDKIKELEGKISKLAVEKAFSGRPLR